MQEETTSQAYSFFAPVCCKTTPSDPAEKQRIVGTDTDTGKKPTPRFRQACRQASDRDAQPSSAPGEKNEKRPGLCLESRDARRTALPQNCSQLPHVLICTCGKGSDGLLQRSAPHACPSFPYLVRRRSDQREAADPRPSLTNGGAQA